MVMGLVVDFMVLFFLAGGWVFLQGFCKKCGAVGGFLLVKLWWITGESWRVDGRILADENFPLFEIYFWGGVKDRAR
jgi:hypothetical protein